MLCFSYESGILEDPKAEGPSDMYQMTKDPKDAPDTPEKLLIEFKNGQCMVATLMEMAGI